MDILTQLTARDPQTNPDAPPGDEIVRSASSSSRAAQESLASSSSPSPGSRRGVRFST